MSLPSNEEDLDMISASYPSSVQEWMKAIRRPTPYRVGNAKLHLKTRTVFYAALFTGALLILFIMFIPRTSNVACNDVIADYTHLLFGVPFNNTYPLTKPTKVQEGLMYRIGLITDLDTNSKSHEKKNIWISYFRTGNLTISDDNKKIFFSLEQPIVLSSSLSQAGRGMELSELVVFNGKLYSIDDRTGVVYEILNGKAIPWVVLPDGDGKHNKGFKSEWATVKDQRLYIGGLGKEWTTITGEVLNLNPQWVKSVGQFGDVRHYDWHNKYNALREKTGTLLPGYMIHESGVWSDIHQKWFFLPRRASVLKYDEVSDERRGTNLLITADKHFKDIHVTHVGIATPTRGFSSFKFVPGTRDTVIVALKSEESGGKIASYMLAFTIHGESVMPEKLIGSVKYEGIEFI